MVVVLAVAAASVVALAVLALVWAKRSRHGATQAVLTPEGLQEARVTVDGRYRPDVLRVRQGVPVRLHFIRNEDNPCSEWVVFSAFGVDRRLPAFQETTVEFVPTATGTFLFTCQWGMYRGKLVVSAPRGKLKAIRRGSGAASRTGPDQTER